MAKIISLRPVTVKSYDPEKDGVSFSTLQKFKNCRELARLHLKGWRPRSVNMGQIFGTIMHTLIQAVLEDVRAGKMTSAPSTKYVLNHVATIEKKWRTDNPQADAETLERLEIMCAVAEGVLPMYFKFWSKDFKLRWNKPEHEFLHPFETDYPKGHALFKKKKMKTFLRGMIDASYHEGSSSRPWLFESKSKSRIGETGESNLTDILPHEMQVGIYLLILQIMYKGTVPAGLMYNIVRRPTVKPKKGEDMHTFAQRIIKDVQKRPEYYFLRLRMTVDKQDLFRRQQELEDVVSDFMLWWKGESGHYKNSDYCENKYGTCMFLPMCGHGDRSRFYLKKEILTPMEEAL
jgi:hypothetical protein